MKKLLLISAILLLTGITGATDIKSENITLDLESSKVNSEMNIKELTTSDLTYTTPYGIENVKAQINGENKTCNVEKLQIGSEIRCPTDEQNNLTVEMSFVATGMFQHRNGIDTVRYRKSFSSPTENFKISMILPESTGIIDQKNVSAPVIYPQNYDVGSTGRRITVSWTKKPELGESTEYQVMYEKLNETEKDEFNFIPVLIALVVLGLFLYILWKRKNQLELDSLYDELSNDEIQLLDLLRDENGEMLQKDAVDQSEYSKAKISEVVSSLEEKEVIVKEKDGRSNKLRIKSHYRY